MIESTINQGDAAFVSQFETLEVKVLRAIQMIQLLKEENARLKKSCEELQQRVVELNGTIDTANQAVQEADRWRVQVQEYEHLKTNISTKICHLLETIDSLSPSDQ